MLVRLREPEAVRSLISAAAISVLMTLARTMTFVCLYRAFGYAVPLDHALVMIPLLLIALILPISIGGFGLREWVLVVGFQGIGIRPRSASRSASCPSRCSSSSARPGLSRTCFAGPTSGCLRTLRPPPRRNDHG